jgi:inosine/xanthosine triphosphatase
LGGIPRVCVGSLNRSKVEGVRRAFEVLVGPCEVVALGVSTGLPPQPLGLAVAVEGARRRAREALARGCGCSYGVGVEAGLFVVGGDFYDVQVACVATAGGSESLGFSPSFAIPRSFAKLLVTGGARELEEVVDRYFGTRDIGSAGGFIRLLTGSRVTREDLTFYAVAMALVPLINAELYGGGLG